MASRLFTDQLSNTHPVPASNTIYLTGSLTASADVYASTVSGSTGLFGSLYANTLDVNIINSISNTVTTLEVADNLIIAASGSTNENLTAAGYQIGGYDPADASYNQPLASIIYANASLSLNVTGSTSAIMYLSGSGEVGIGVADPDSPLEILSSSSPQLKISYDGSNYATFAVSSAGDLTVTPSGGDATIAAAITGSSGLTITGSAKFNDEIEVADHIFPAADNTYDLGSSSKRWRNIYTGDLHLRNERGDWTIVEEEDFLCVVNNKTGKKYEMLLKPIED